jgi:predicted ATPase/DNA-binding XRE family transcriptional regulator
MHFLANGLAKRCILPKIRMSDFRKTVSPLTIGTFGDLLKYLRRRARLTQQQLGIAVGYSEGYISRLESNQRHPDLATLAALFIPALGLEDEPEIVTHLMGLAANTHQDQPRSGESLFLSHTYETVEVKEESIPSNLPLQLTSFIGRDNEITKISQLLTREEPARLITLTGIGGIGKTRLSIQTAIALSHLYRDGVWFVDLAPLTSPELVPQTVASIWGITASHNQPIMELLIRFLRTKHMLIVLDNCEHLIPAAAKLAAELLRACAHVQIEATSREVLSVPGEVNFQVPPLSLPQEEEYTSQTAIELESVQLFVERARHIQPSFTLTQTNAPIITRICRKLDGMPLAIELAAARINLLTPDQIEVRLNHRLQLLTGGQRILQRHQTLRATLAWSHDLLSEPEQVLFRRLSVFAGGWTLDAANAVCGENGTDIFDLLTQLVNKSLVVVEREPDAEARYTMLETIREYAREKLLASVELETLRTRHFNYFYEMAQQAEARLFAEVSSIDWAETEIDNIRATLAWALERDSSGALSEENTGRALELMLHIWPLWLNRGYAIEGDQWLNQFLLAHRTSNSARARGLLLAGDFAGFRGDSNKKAALIQESLTLAMNLEDDKRVAWALMEMGLTERDRDYPESIKLFIESIKMFEELDETLWVYRTSFLLAETYMIQGDLEAARPLWKKGIDLSRAENDNFHVAWGLEGLGTLERLENHLEQAEQLYTESLRLKVSVMDKMGIAYSLAAFAQLAAAQKQFKRAAVLWGAAEQLGETLNLLLIPSKTQLYTSMIPDTRVQLDEGVFSAAWMEGRQMKMQEAIKYALKTN